jgi:hypothetical protein
MAPDTKLHVKMLLVLLGEGLKGKDAVSFFRHTHPLWYIALLSLSPERTLKALHRRSFTIGA